MTVSLNSRVNQLQFQQLKQRQGINFEEARLIVFDELRQTFEKVEKELLVGNSASVKGHLKLATKSLRRQESPQQYGQPIKYSGVTKDDFREKIDIIKRSLQG